MPRRFCFFSTATISSTTSRTIACASATTSTRRRSVVRTTRRSGIQRSASAPAGPSSRATPDTTSTPTRAGVSRQNRGISARGIRRSSFSLHFTLSFASHPCNLFRFTEVLWIYLDRPLRFCTNFCKFLFSLVRESTYASYVRASLLYYFAQSVCT